MTQIRPATQVLQQRDLCLASPETGAPTRSVAIRIFHQRLSFGARLWRGQLQGLPVLRFGGEKPHMVIWGDKKKIERSMPWKIDSLEIYWKGNAVGIGQRYSCWALGQSC